MQLAYAVPASTLQEEMTTTSKKWRLQGHRGGGHHSKPLQTDSGTIQKARGDPKVGARQHRRQDGLAGWRADGTCSRQQHAANNTCAHSHVCNTKH